MRLLGDLLVQGRFSLVFRAMKAASIVRREWVGRGEINHPFDSDHSFRCYHNTAYPVGVFSAVFGAKSSALNYGILLYFPEVLITRAADLARPVPAMNWRLLARHGEVTVRDVRRELGLHGGLTGFARALLEVLATGYVCTYLNEFYLPGAQRYLRQPFKHETLLTGYEPEAGNVLAPFYGRDGEFRLRRIPLAAVLMAFASQGGWPRRYTYDDTDRADGYCSALRKPVYCIRVSARPSSKLQTDLILSQLEDVYHSRSSYSEYIGDPLTNWREGPGRFGLGFYEGFCAYLKNRQSGFWNFDLKITRVLWEHNLVMLDRIAALRAEGMKIRSGVEEQYQWLAAAAHWIHLHVFSKRRRRRDVDVPGIQAKLRAMESRERSALSALMEDMRSSGCEA